MGAGEEHCFGTLTVVKFSCEQRVAGEMGGCGGHAPYSGRPRIVWPGGARIAVWLAPNIEHYELEPPDNPRNVNGRASATTMLPRAER